MRIGVTLAGSRLKHAEFSLRVRACTSLSVTYGKVVWPDTESEAEAWMFMKEVQGLKF